MEIIAPFQAKVKRRQRKSQEKTFVPKRKEKDNLLPKEVASAFNIEPMNDTSMKELIALNARGKWVCSKAWTGSASNAKTDESASVSSLIAEYGGSSPSSSSFWLLKVISGWITCARDHQRRHLHHSAKVFFIQLFFPKYGIWFFLVAIRRGGSC